MYLSTDERSTEAVERIEVFEPAPRRRLCVLYSGLIEKAL
jgi:hypothetical protein